MNPCKNKTHKKYKKKFKSEDILPTTDEVVMIKKNTTKGYYTTCLIKKKQKIEKKNQTFRDFYVYSSAFFKSEKKNLQIECPPPIRRLASILFCSMTAEFSNF